MSLFEPFALGQLQLSNRIVMAPMTRSRAIGNVPNALMAQYYGQRSSAGLIITEGVAPSPNGLGYARIPGVFSAEQVEAWKPIAQAAHAGGAKIFMQLMHCGRITHPLNLPQGAETVAPSAIAAKGQMWTDQEGMKDMPVPRALQTSEIPGVIVKASQNAIAAGFDGVELHGANGYLIEQFLNAGTNQRTDAYGGSWENRNRFAIEAAAAVAKAIGAERTAIRLSPFNVFNDMIEYPEIPEQYTALARELKLAYIHLVNYSRIGDQLLKAMKDAFGGPVILNGGMTKEKAEAALAAGLGDLASFGSSFLANPDLPRRLREGLPLNQPNPDTFYTPGEQGYTDYPTAA
jgi:N-ethylmaleimide reductase